MDFDANETPIEVIREGAFGGTYFRDIYSSVSKKWYKNNGNNLISWKILIGSFIVPIIMMSVLINMVLNAKRCQDFRKIRVALMKLMLKFGTSGILGTG